jgi:hypothetical protein
VCLFYFILLAGIIFKKFAALNFLGASCRFYHKEVYLFFLRIFGDLSPFDAYLAIHNASVSPLGHPFQCLANDEIVETHVKFIKSTLGKGDVDFDHAHVVAITCEFLRSLKAKMYKLTGHQKASGKHTDPEARRLRNIEIVKRYFATENAFKRSTNKDDAIRADYKFVSCATLGRQRLQDTNYLDKLMKSTKLWPYDDVSMDDQSVHREGTEGAEGEMEVGYDIDDRAEWIDLPDEEDDEEEEETTAEADSDEEEDVEDDYNDVGGY